MGKEEFIIKGKLVPASAADIDKGWIRISHDLRRGLPERCYVRVSVGKRKVLCQIRGTPGKQGVIKVDYHYRRMLSLSIRKKNATLRIKRVSFLGRLGALASHPDDVVRNGIALGLLSVGLGALAATVGTFGVSLKCVFISNFWVILLGALGFATAVFFLIVSGLAFWYGGRALSRKDIA